MNVTIGIPFYNAESYLHDSLRSVFAQTHQEWELILIDDGSTDRSLEIARSINDPRVRVVSDGRNLRLAARLNQITHLARFDVLARMDADDLMAPERIARQIEVLSCEPEIDLVSTGLISIGRNEDPIGIRSHCSETVTRQQLIRRSGTGIVHASVLGRKSWFLRNPYDASIPIAQDYELWLRASRSADLKVRVIREPLYYVRELSSATPDKLLRSYRMDRRSIRMHMRSPTEWLYVCKSAIKSQVLRAIVSAGQFERLIERRSRPLDSPDVIAKFHSDISVIRSVLLPGLY